MNWPFQNSEATLDQISAFLQLGSHPLTESRHLEFKSALDADPIEVARDVSALANGGGGLVLFGVSEQTGSATGTPGLENPEADYQRIDQIIRERCDLPPVYKPFFSQASLAGRKILVIQVLPELAHLIFVREELRSPAKYSCYVRTGPGKGHALTTSQVRHELLRRLDYQARKESLARELEHNHHRVRLPESLRIGVTFTPDLPHQPAQRLQPQKMQAIEETFRKSQLRDHPARSSPVPMPWMAQRVLEGLAVSSNIRRGTYPSAAFALTDTGLLTTEHFIRVAQLDANSFSQYALHFEGSRCFLDLERVLEVFQELAILVDALRGNLMLPSSGQWHLHVVMPHELYAVRWWEEGARRRWCRISPLPFTSLFSREDPWRLGSITEPHPANSFGEVSSHLLTCLAGGFGFQPMPGPTLVIPGGSA